MALTLLQDCEKHNGALRRTSQPVIDTHIHVVDIPPNWTIMRTFFSNGLKLHPQVVKFGNILMVYYRAYHIGKTQPGFEGHHTVSPQVSG